MAEIKIPCAAVGSQTEQLIRDAVEVTRENNVIRRKFTRRIFSNTSQLERGTNNFNASLYNSILEYGESKKYFHCGAWIPSTEELLEIFNRAYQIATMAINMEVPIDRWGDFWDMASIWVKLDPETAAWEGESHQRNLPALYAIYAMVHAIVDMEKDKSEYIEKFLYKIRTDEYINEAMEFFLLADKQSLLPPTSSTPPTAKRGAPKTQLFTDGREEQYAEHFRNFLLTNEYDLVFSEDMTEKVNIALMCFLYELNINLDGKDTACFRFLEESCGLEYKTTHKEQRLGQKWCKSFAKVKDSTPKGATFRLVKQFIEDNNVIE